MTVVFWAGCGGKSPPPVVPVGADCDSPPVPTDFSVPESFEFGGGRDVAVLSVLVDEEGHVREARIETGSGSAAFDQAVLRAARDARFRPGIVDCEPVEQWTKMMFPGEEPGRDTPPSYINGNEMERMLRRVYPPILRNGTVEGRTVVLMYVDRSGLVLDAWVRESSGHQDLDRAALRVARIARFTPAMHDGEAVAVLIILPVSFSVRS